MINEVLKISHDLSDAIRLLENNIKRTVVVIDENKRFFGTITDGDVRRCLLGGNDISTKLLHVANVKAITCKTTDDIEYVKQKMTNNNIEAIPILDEENKLVRLFGINDIVINKKIDANSNFEAAIIMAGGEGKRLRPITNDIPKAMVSIGNVSLIEQQIKKLVLYGIKDIYISINYLGKMIEDHIGNGSSLGANITYINEEKKLGTGGALSLLPSKIPNNILVINTDILSNVNFNNFFKYHKKHKASLCVGTIEYKYTIPFGVLAIHGERVKNLEEKPEKIYYCSGGIYAIETDLIKLIPKNTFYNITELIAKAIEKGKKVVAYPIFEKWVDVGTVESLEKAKKLFSEGAFNEVSV